MRKRLLSCILLIGAILCFHSNTFAQSEQDSLSAELIIDSLQQVFVTANSTLARQKAEEIINDFKDQEYWSFYYKAVRTWYDFEKENANHTSAILLLQNALADLPSDQYNNKAKMESLMAFSYNEKGDLFASLQNYEQSLSNFKQSQDTAWLAYLFGNLAISYTQLGDYSKAIDYGKESIYLYKTMRDTQSVWSNYFNLSLSYFFSGNINEAEKISNEQSNIFDPLDGTFSSNRASYAKERGQFALALTETNIAIARCSIAYEGDSYCAGLKKMKAEILIEQGKANEALTIINESLTSFNEVSDQREWAKLLIVKASAHRLLNNHETALDFYQQALVKFIPNFENNDPEINPSESLWTTEIWLMEIFRGKALSFLSLFESNNIEAELQSALANFESATLVIQLIKSSYDGTESKLLSGTYTHPFYEDLIHTQWVAFQENGDSSLLRSSFQVAQKANAYVLREMVSEEKAINAAGVPDSLIAEINQKQKEINFQESQINSYHKDSLNSSTSQLFGLQQTLLDKKNKLRQNYPLYASLENEIPVATELDIQSKLDSNTLLVKYFLGTEYCFIFSLTQDSFHVEQKLIPQAFTQWIGDYSKSLSDLEFVLDSTEIAEEIFTKRAHELYKFLLASTINHYQDASLTRLQIIPDGILHTIPFQALQVNPSDNWDNIDNYLIASYAVSYAFYSGMVLSEDEELHWNNDFVSFGLEFDNYTLQYLDSLSNDSITNPTIAPIVRGGKLTKLPFSDDEAREIATMMGGSSWLNEEATRENFVSEIQDAGIIHIATHSLVNYDKRNKSSLLFNKTRDDVENFLHQDEIYGMKLKASMFVMSACNTAFGNLWKSEGVNSLARAVSFSGVPSIVATLWSISDEASMKIMVEYYKFLKEGLSKDVAMQQAQLSYLKSNKLSSPAFRIPIYWAAWTVIGNRSGFTKQPSFSLNMGLTAVGLMGVILGLGVIRRKKRLDRK